MQLLDDDVVPGESDHGDGERHADQEDQALGHESDDAGHRRDQPVRHRVVRTQLAPQQQRSEREEDPSDDAKHLVDAGAELRRRQLERLGLLDEPMDPGVLADPSCDRQGTPRDDDAAGQHFVTGKLQHRIGLAGERGLVDFQTVPGQHLGVDRDLVAGAELDQIVEHHVIGWHLDGVTFAREP